MIEAAVWQTYVQGYLAEMRLSYQRERAKWDALLGLSRVVLVCDCPSHCHRTILRERILPKLGAVDCGELPE